MHCPSCGNPYQPGNRFCGRCGLALPANPPAGQSGPVYPGALYPAAANRPAAFALGMPGGFWIRVLPYIIDRLIIPLPLILLWMLLGLPTPDFSNITEALDSPPAFQRLQMTIAFLILLYDTAFIALRGATPGKQVFGLYVVRADGSRIGWGRALARHLLTALTLNFTLGLGFLVVALHPDKRGLHDLICDTVVVRRDRQEV